MMGAIWRNGLDIFCRKGATSGITMNKPLLLLSFVSIMALARADSWPQWLGPRRDGVWRESDILEKFPAAGPEILWRKELHGGYAGPAVADGLVIITDRIAGPPMKRAPGERGIPELPGQERVLALEAGTGKVRWEHIYEARYRIDFPSGPRATPVIDGERVYVLGAMGDLFCLKAADGKAAWHVNLMKHFSLGEPPVWGWAAHPLLHKGRIIVLAGGPGSAVAAFDAVTGKEAWRALDAKEIGYAPPTIATVNGQEQLMVWYPEAVAGLDPETGKQLWTVAYPVEGKHQRPEVTIAMPRVENDVMVITSFYHGALALKFEGGEPKVLWNKKSTSRSSFNAGLHTTMTTPILKDGYIYGICGGGELRCLDAKSGERVWETLEHLKGKPTMFGTSFLIEQGGRFLIWTDLGDLVMAKLSPERYEETGRAHLLEPLENARGRDVTWSHPAFAEKKLFGRNSKELICVDLGRKG
jgi:outer membrane protein assembly factor BamB